MFLLKSLQIKKRIDKGGKISVKRLGLVIWFGIFEDRAKLKIDIFPTLIDM